MFKESTNLDAMYGELGRIPMNIHRKLILIKYWYKLLKQKEHTILFKTYTMLQRDADDSLTYNGRNWAHHIKTLLNQIKLSNYGKTNITIQWNTVLSNREY